MVDGRRAGRRTCSVTIRLRWEHSDERRDKKEYISCHTSNGQAPYYFVNRACCGGCRHCFHMLKFVRVLWVFWVLKVVFEFVFCCIFKSDLVYLQLATRTRWWSASWLHIPFPALVAALPCIKCAAV